MDPFRSRTTVSALCAALVLPSLLLGRMRQVDPTTYKSAIGSLIPGDTIRLAAGDYLGLTLQNVHGTADSGTCVTGPAQGAAAVIKSRSGYNTVQLYNCSYLSVKYLDIDLGGLPVNGVNAKDYPSHHILIENCRIHGFPPNSQQIVGISTKSPAWAWTIRNNTIVEPGTGLYLGNSDGRQPFIGGVIEGNCVLRSTGYCMQIKYQVDYQLPAGMIDEPHTTIIRHNVFIKDDRPSPDGARPNLLVDGFPDTGPGSRDHYEIYGNFFYYNPRERLFQGSGRVALHNNIFVNPAGSAVLFQAHDGKAVKVSHIFNNTVYATGTGISGAAGSESHAVAGNLVFAATPISYSGTAVRDNATGTTADAVTYVNTPSGPLGQLDFYPRPGRCQGTGIDMALFSSYVEYDRDFNGADRGAFVFRGAYAGEGTNPGWQLDSTEKTTAPLVVVAHRNFLDPAAGWASRFSGTPSGRYDVLGRFAGPAILPGGSFDRPPGKRTQMMMDPPTLRVVVAPETRP